MKMLMLKQKLKFKTDIRRLLSVVLITSALVGGTIYSAFARADQFDAQIQALQDQNASNRAASNQLAAQASGYQDAINRLNAQINALQDSITQNQQQIDSLQQQIDDDQAKLDKDKDILGNDIRTMYLEGQISTLEILAASKDLSEFVDKEQYRTEVQNKIKTTIDQITQLKLQLQEQQQQLQSRLKDEQNQKSELANTQAQQNQLLAYTEGQKAAYDQQIRSNNSQIASLRAQQAAANARLGGRAVAGDPGHGGYPAVWDNAPQDSLLDNWGMLNRECVSYTAWKVYQTYGYMPYWGGVGNANQWPGDAAAAGISTGSVPRVHSVAIAMGGAYGHAMWVEAVNGSTIYVSQYNYGLDGRYSEMSINGSGLIYIYFGG